MSIIRKYFIAMVVLALANTSSEIARADNTQMLIIANKSVGKDSTSTAELKSIFLKKRSRWSNGGRAIPINAKGGTRVRKLFRAKVLEMSRDQENKYWQDEKIRRGESPPAEFSNVLKAVYMLKNSVGYVLKKDYKPGLVKVLARY